MDNNWLTIENIDGEVVLTECSKEAKGEIIVPEGVSEIGSEAFYECADINTVIIPNSVISIGSDAFHFCTGLKHVIIPNSVKNIEMYAFIGCKSLTSVTIPQSVESIDDGVFADCSGLISIKVDPENKHFDSRDDCNAIVETANNMIIADCQNTVIPKGVTSVCIRGHRECCIEIGQIDGDISLLSFPENIYWYADCEVVTIYNGITRIASNAFCDCDHISTIIIPESVRSIHDEAFRFCQDLTSITIPDNVTDIGKGIFCGCHNLTSVVVSPGNPRYDSRNNCNSIIETASNTLIAGCKLSTIPNDVISIAGGAFEFTDFSALVIPERVKSIEDYAFNYCHGVIIVPDTVRIIGEYAFSDCKDIFIPESVTSNGELEFENCKVFTYKLLK